MSVSKCWLDEYNALPAPARKWVLRVLKEWGGWSRSTVYRKLECPTLCRLENLLLESVVRAAHGPQLDGQQLVIDFDWSGGEGMVNMHTA